MNANGVLPADIQEVWGQTERGTSMARYLIGEWGLDRFRASQIHQLALIEQQYQATRKQLQDDFRGRDLKAMGEK